MANHRYRNNRFEHHYENALQSIDAGDKTKALSQARLYVNKTFVYHIKWYALISDILQNDALAQEYKKLVSLHNDLSSNIPGAKEAIKSFITQRTIEDTTIYLWKNIRSIVLLGIFLELKSEMNLNKDEELIYKFSELLYQKKSWDFLHDYDYYSDTFDWDFLFVPYMMYTCVEAFPGKAQSSLLKRALQYEDIIFSRKPEYISSHNKIGQIKKELKKKKKSEQQKRRRTYLSRYLYLSTIVVSLIIIIFIFFVIWNSWK